jgi:hypothetical protein
MTDVVNCTKMNLVNELNEMNFLVYEIGYFRERRLVFILHRKVIFMSSNIVVFQTCAIL